MSVNGFYMFCKGTQIVIIKVQSMSFNDNLSHH